MKVNVTVKTNSKFEEVLEEPGGSYIVRVSTPPVDGKANKQVIKLLSKHLKVPKSKILLIKGHKSKVKVFEIED
jgi:hypothetical protein